MIIERVRTAVHTRRYDGAQRTSRKTWTHKNALLVFVECKGGEVGVGEAWCAAGSPRAVAEIIEADLASMLIGRDAQSPESLWCDMIRPTDLSARGGTAYCAVSGVDIALWDLLGKASGQPIWRILGGFSRRVAVYSSGGMYGEPPERLAARMADLVRAGACGVKIKVGGAALDEDVARIRAVRDAIGPKALLLLDALFLPDVPAAIRLSRAAEPYDVAFFEAPTAMNDLAGWREIRERTNIPLAGTELQWGRGTHRDLLLDGTIRFLEFDLTVCGGITEGRKIAALSQAFHKPWSLHCAGSGVGLAASLQFAGGLAGCHSTEMHEMHQALFSYLWDGGYGLDNGDIVLPETPGLGLDIRFEDVPAEDAAG